MTMTINPKNESEHSEHKGNLKGGKGGLPWGHYINRCLLLVPLLVVEEKGPRGRSQWTRDKG